MCAVSRLSTGQGEKIHREHAVSSGQQHDPMTEHQTYLYHSINYFYCSYMLGLLLLDQMYMCYLHSHSCLSLSLSVTL